MVNIHNISHIRQHDYIMSRLNWKHSLHDETEYIAPLSLSSVTSIIMCRLYTWAICSVLCKYVSLRTSVNQYYSMNMNSQSTKHTNCFFLHFVQFRAHIDQQLLMHKRIQNNKFNKFVLFQGQDNISNAHRRTKKNRYINKFVKRNVK